MELVLELGQLDLGAAREDAVQDGGLVGAQRLARRAGELPRFQSVREKTVPLWISSIRRNPRTARSMTVAETSMVSADSSMIVPTIPGWTPGGGLNWTAISGLRPRRVGCGRRDGPGGDRVRGARGQARRDAGVPLVPTPRRDEHAHDARGKQLRSDPAGQGEQLSTLAWPASRPTRRLGCRASARRTQRGAATSRWSGPRCRAGCRP